MLVLSMLEFESKHGCKERTPPGCEEPEEENCLRVRAMRCRMEDIPGGKCDKIARMVCPGNQDAARAGNMA